MWDVIGNNLSCFELCAFAGIQLPPSPRLCLHRYSSRGTVQAACATWTVIFNLSPKKGRRKRRMPGTCMQGIISMFGSNGKCNSILDYVMLMDLQWSVPICWSKRTRTRVCLAFYDIRGTFKSASVSLFLLFVSFSECDMNPNIVLCTPMTLNWTRAPVWCCGFAFGNTPLILPLERLVLCFEMRFQKQFMILWCCVGVCRRLDFKTDAFMEPLE